MKMAIVGVILFLGAIITGGCASSQRNPGDLSDSAMQRLNEAGEWHARQVSLNKQKAGQPPLTAEQLQLEKDLYVSNYIASYTNNRAGEAISGGTSVPVTNIRTLPYSPTR